jgi:hypothetical protein
MLTKTSKEILGTLSNVVEQLLTILSNYEAKKTPIPNLTDLSAGVQAQVVNLSLVGDKIVKQSNSDEKLKKGMPAAAKLGKH